MQEPEAADYYFLPVPTQSYAAMGAKKAKEEVTSLLEYVRVTWPFYDRSHGVDHVMVAGGKLGACDLFDGQAMPGAVQVYHDTHL